MEQLKLPDGRYINPARVGGVEIVGHFLRSDFYVRLCTRDGGTVDVQEHMTQSAAAGLKARIEKQLEALHAKSSPYEDGYRDGYEEGQRSGLTAGRAEGFRAGQENRQLINAHEAEQCGAARVLNRVQSHREELLKELSYTKSLREGRRRSLNDMVALLTTIADECAPPSEPETEDMPTAR